MTPLPHRPLGEILTRHFTGAITFDFTRYVIAASLMALILLATGGWARRRRIQAGKHASAADYRREFLSSLRTVFVFAITTLTTLAMKETGFLRFGDHFAWTPFLVQFVAVVLAHDTYFYWIHRAMHHRRLFRAMHLHHHLSRTPTPWTAYSFSVWEAVVEGAFMPLFLFGMGLMNVHFLGLTVVAFLNHQIARNVMGHSGTELMPRFWVDSRWSDWITSTTHHDLHHSDGRYNFGLYFTWWDRWMGTEHPRYKDVFREVVGRPRRSPAMLSATPNS